MKVFDLSGSLDPVVADALSELGNVGVGSATSTLGNLLRRRIVIQTPQVLSVDTDISSLTRSAPDEVCMGIMMRLTQNLSGVVIILLGKEFMSDLIFELTGVRYVDNELVEDEDSLSVVEEVANIMAASYMTAIGAYTKLRIFLTPMMVGLDMAEALIAYPVAQMSLSGENVICIDSSFSLRDCTGWSKNGTGRIIMLPDEQSVHTLATALRL